MRRNSLNKQILALALPAIVANITTPLLSLVDVAIVGHLGSAVYVGAIAVGGSIFNMLYWLFSFLRFGTSGLTALSVGRGDDAEMRLTGLRSLLVAVALGLLLVLFQRPLSYVAFGLIDAGESVRALAEVYFNVLIFGAPAVMIQYSLTGWFVGAQDTRTPMLVSLAINVINIGVSLLLVYRFNLGITGVAAGTLVAQWAGCLLSLAFFAARTRRIASSLRALLNFSALKRFFSVNLDVFLRTLCLIAVTVWFTRAGAANGPVILAVNTLLLQLFTLFSYFMDGFAFAAEALCGKLAGARDFVALRACINRFMAWGIGVALLFTALYALGGAAFLGLLTDDVAVISASAEFRLWGAAIPLAGFMAFTCDGIAIGLTRTRLMLLSMAFATAVFFLTWRLASPALANHGLWLAFLLYLLARGLLLSALLRRSTHE